MGAADAAGNGERLAASGGAGPRAENRADVRVEMVPGAGFEPAWPRPADFKSAASTLFHHPGGMDAPGGGTAAPADVMEAEVGIEPASTALQAAA